MAYPFPSEDIYYCQYSEVMPEMDRDWIIKTKSAKKALTIFIER